jgi:hypothetical protein
MHAPQKIKRKWTCADVATYKNQADAYQQPSTISSQQEILKHAARNKTMLFACSSNSAWACSSFCYLLMAHGLVANDMTACCCLHKPVAVSSAHTTVDATTIVHTPETRAC